MASNRQEGMPSANVYTLRAAANISPKRQGELDGLCGLYAIINAARIARLFKAPMAMAEELELFEAGLREIAKRHDVAEVARHGMRWKTLRRVARVIGAKASRPGCALLIDELPKGTPDSLQATWIRQQLLLGQPIVVHLSKQAHYSVIVGWTLSQYKLFDSNGRYRTAMRSSTKAFAVAMP